MHKVQADAPVCEQLVIFENWKLLNCSVGMFTLQNATTMNEPGKSVVEICSLEIIFKMEGYF